MDHHENRPQTSPGTAWPSWKWNTDLTCEVNHHTTYNSRLLHIRLELLISWLGRTCLSSRTFIYIRSLPIFTRWKWQCYSQGISISTTSHLKKQFYTCTHQRSIKTTEIDLNQNSIDAVLSFKIIWYCLNKNSIGSTQNMDREELSIMSVGIGNKSFSLIAKFGRLTHKLHNYYIV